MYKNKEGYSSPTEGEALGRIAKEERAARKAAQKNINEDGSIRSFTDDTQSFVDNAADANPER